MSKIKNKKMVGKESVCLTLGLGLKLWPSIFSGICNGIEVVADLGFPPAGSGLLLFICF